MHGYIFTDDTIQVDLNTGMRMELSPTCTLSPKTTPGKSFTLLPIVTFRRYKQMRQQKYYRPFGVGAINLAAGYR
jgi:hypothetical protein